VDLGIRGKVALVAASSKGLGRAVAEELANEGVNLIMCARGEQTLRGTAEWIRTASKVKVVDVVADLSNPADADRVVRAGFDAFGQVDILVNNSGGPPNGPFESFTPEMWTAATHQILESVVGITRAVLPGMKERRWGRILNVTSIAAKQPVEGLMLSNSLRAAVIGFARTLANEVAAFGVTVNNLLPGYTKTDRVKQLAAASAGRPGGAREDIYSRWEKEIPMARLGEPREFAALAAFLASDRASYITASSIAVDGGWIRSLL
jgi:3-oxoacyl-[acyl-carrier protein] reductase